MATVTYILHSLQENPAIMTGADATHLPLYAFIGATMVTVSLFGGTFSVLPAHVASVFGSKYMAGCTGRMLLGSATAVTVAPRLLASSRQSAIDDAISQLSTSVDPIAFEQKYGMPLTGLDELVEAKVHTSINFVFSTTNVTTTTTITTMVK